MSDLLLEFAQNEAGENSIFSMQWQAIEKAPLKALAENDKVEVLFHLLRRSGLPKVVSRLKKDDVSAFLAACELYASEEREPYHNDTRRIGLLYVTGVYRDKTLAAGPVTTLDELKKWNELLVLSDKFPHYNVRLNSLIKFSSLGVEHGARSLETLAAFDFVHRRDNGAYSDIQFLGMLLTALAEPKTRDQTLAGLIGADLNERASHLELAKHHVEKVCDKLKPEASFLELRDQFNQVLKGLRETSEGSKLAQQLGLSVNADAAWTTTLKLQSASVGKIEFVFGSNPDSPWFFYGQEKLKDISGLPKLVAGLQPDYEKLEVRTNYKNAPKKDTAAILKWLQTA